MDDKGYYFLLGEYTIGCKVYGEFDTYIKTGSFDDENVCAIDKFVDEFVVTDWLPIVIDEPKMIWVLYYWGIHEEPLLWHKYVDTL